MGKRGLFGLLLALGCLVALYLLRVPLLAAALSAALDSRGIRVLALQGVDWQRGRVFIAHLEVGVGAGAARQSVQGLRLDYRAGLGRGPAGDQGPVFFQPLALTATRVTLREPKSTPGSRGGDKPLLLTELFGHILALPLQTLQLPRVEIEGAGIAILRPPLAVQASRDGEAMSLAARDADKRLELVLQRSAPDALALRARLTWKEASVARLDATLSQQGETHRLQGQGELDPQALSLLAAPLLELPVAVSAGAGQLGFELSGEFDEAVSAQMQHAWQLKVLPEIAPTLTLELPTGAHTTTVHVGLAEPITLGWRTAGAQGFAVTGRAPRLALQLLQPGHSLEGAGELAGLHCEYALDLRCEAALDLPLASPAVTLAGDPAMEMKGIQARLNARLALAEGRLLATLAPGELLTVRQLTRGDSHLRQARLVAGSAVTGEYELDAGRYHLRADALRVLLPRLETPQLNVATRLALSNLAAVMGEQTPGRASFQLSTDSLNLQRPGTWLPGLALAADVSLEQQRLTIQAQVDSDRRKHLFSLTAKHRLDSGRGNARLLADAVTFDSGPARLSRYFAHWPFDWDIYQGSASTDAKLSWQPKAGISGNIRQNLQGLAGVYRNIGFIGLDADFRLDLNPQGVLVTPRPAKLSLQTLDVGVPVQSLTARVLLDSGSRQLKIQSAEATLFGGRIWTRDAEYLGARARNRFDIGVDGLQLGQMLALAGYEAVEGAGRISGLLPLDVNAAGVVMQRGMLAAKAPGGVLRYRSAVTANTSAAMKPVMQALSNYHFTVLQVEADYAENGDLLLEMRLRGSNPDYEQGRPIHLNLNVTDNIPALLKSLQAGRSITEAVSRKLGSRP